MKAADLKEAAQIVSSLAWFEKARKWTLQASGTGGNLLLIQPAENPTHFHQPSPETVAISRGAAEAALKTMQMEWATREAQLRRRAAQIGLTLP